MKTKIICTIGPASQSPGTLRSLAEAGMAVARLNFSHGTHEEHARHIGNIRAVNREQGRDILILLDLEGWRIRVGSLPEGGIPLFKGQELILSSREVAPDGKNQAVIPINYDDDLSGLSPESRIFIDDGNIELSVATATRHAVCARVIIPGLLKSRKGINIPEFRPAFFGLSKKDQSDIEFGIRHGVEWIAQSFVRNREDVLLVRNRAGGHPCRIFAKIENREGIDRIEEILEAADGILIARGDMGVSIPVYQVPVMQKRIIRLCNQEGKTDITATQMLESMTVNPRPTRAEVSDVANAVIDGSDYVMLSGETAVGKYPVQTVEMMRKIIEFTEAHYEKPGEG